MTSARYRLASAVLPFACVAAALAASFAAPAHAEVRETLGYEYYDASVAPGQTLLAALNAASTIREDGRTFHGHTGWYVKWTFRWYENADRSCRITSVTTTVDTKITLPRISGGTPAQQQEFARFSAALKEHELGHRAVGKNAAEAVTRAIQSLPQMADCRQLEKTANDTGKRVIREHNEEDKRYDARTRHGRDQGAWLER